MAAVLVVGGGPTGLMAANLLGARGVSVLLVEQHPGTSDDAKAISLDDESMRSLQLAGLDGAVYPIIVPGTGTKYYGSRGQELVHARGSADGYRFGHPFKNPFAQPDLERELRAGLDRFPHVEQRFGTQLSALRQTGTGVDVVLRAGTGPGTGNDDLVSVDYVLGCDGGRSTVREALGITMRGRSFDQVWCVMDLLEDPHDERYGMHHGDPRRPHVIVPGRGGRCRYEFLLHPGEGAAGVVPPFELLRELVRPFRALEPDQVERAVSYRFHALLAERLRNGRCFLLGDAAHMMPPFAGQGLNSGLRDAVNLSWKVAEVLSGRADDRLLDTYEQERRPHAQAVIDLSVRLGSVVMTTDRRRAAARDLVTSTVMRTRRGRRYLAEMRYRPSVRLSAGAIAVGAETHPLVGSPLPQPRALHGADHRLVRLDDVLGDGWSLLGVGLGDDDWQAPGIADLPAAVRVDVVLDDRSARPRSGREAVADADGRIAHLFDGCRGRLVLLRPDRVVAAVVAPAAASAAALELRRAGVLGGSHPQPDPRLLVPDPRTSASPALGGTRP